MFSPERSTWVTNSSGVKILHYFSFSPDGSSTWTARIEPVNKQAPLRSHNKPNLVFNPTLEMENFPTAGRLEVRLPACRGHLRRKKPCWRSLCFSGNFNPGRREANYSLESNLSVGIKKRWHLRTDWFPGWRWASGLQRSPKQPRKSCGGDCSPRWKCQVERSDIPASALGLSENTAVKQR